ncbi:MAG: NADH-quinone oxidoreductase subunit NuoB [Candidatus Omnitrophota bacterium]|nr:MAG: NADH-quinone oxidoreductase subunit NuoB [Candidatus Omnitrophota bacterium]
MGLKEKILTKSLWVFHISVGSCNNCDIEILDCLTPRFDIERFGMQLIGSIRHADVLLVTGALNRKSTKKLKVLYEQAPKPCFVVAVGTCPCSRHMFEPSYNTVGSLDEVIPVDVYIPGCPPKPEAMIAGIAKLINKATGKSSS